MIKLIPLLILLTACRFSRQVAKTEAKRDSVATGQYDDTRLQKIIDQINESKRSISTSEKGVQLQPIVIEGKTQYVPTPWERNTVDLTEINQKLSAITDSINKKGDTTKTVSNAIGSKDVDAKIGLPWYVWFIGAVAVYLSVRDIIIPLAKYRRAKG